MKVLIPKDFSPSMLVSSNAVEAYPTYNPATSYAKDTIVDYGIRLYQSLVNTNVGNQPDISPLSWVDIGPDNKHAMFDSQVSTQTTSTSPLTVVLNTGAIDSLYVGNVAAATVKLTVRDGLGGTIIYEQTKSLTGSITADWFEYFFSDVLTNQTQALFTGIPSVTNSHCTLEFLSTGTIAVGQIAFGRIQELGATSMGVQSGIRDYSRKETDDFGTTSFVVRGFSKWLNVQLIVTRARFNLVQRNLYALRAKPVVWIGSDNTPEYDEALVVYGYFKDFVHAIDYYSHSICDLEIEGLT